MRSVVSLFVIPLFFVTPLFFVSLFVVSLFISSLFVASVFFFRKLQYFTCFATVRPAGASFAGFSVLCHSLCAWQQLDLSIWSAGGVQSWRGVDDGRGGYGRGQTHPDTFFFVMIILLYTFHAVEEVKHTRNILFYTVALPRLYAFSWPTLSW